MILDAMSFLQWQGCNSLFLLIPREREIGTVLDRVSDESSLVCEIDRTCAIRMLLEHFFLLEKGTRQHASHTVSLVTVYTAYNIQHYKIDCYASC